MRWSANHSLVTCAAIGLCLAGLGAILILVDILLDDAVSLLEVSSLLPFAIGLLLGGTVILIVIIKMCHHARFRCAPVYTRIVDEPLSAIVVPVEPRVWLEVRVQPCDYAMHPAHGDTVTSGDIAAHASLLKAELKLNGEHAADMVLPRVAMESIFQAYGVAKMEADGLREMNNNTSGTLYRATVRNGKFHGDETICFNGKRVYEAKWDNGIPTHVTAWTTPNGASERAVQIQNCFSIELYHRDAV